jgi:1-aminocyclopropane-1-carboxylate deaminase/D-cysteine desulfhydrase-like pyridoxal-dependent ACC family enzyme
MTRPNGLGRLDALPRAKLGRGPTPLDPAPRLSAANGGAALLVKRDDSFDLAFGGNKVRQLDYYFGAARAEGADTVLITGAVQSNYCRLAAAFAAKLGMECHIQQEERVAKDDPLYRRSGNVLIERLLGATLHAYPHGEDEAGADAALEALADRLRAAGRRPYVIHLAPGHPPLGALGYVRCAEELLAQLDALDQPVDRIAVPSGSGATHAGLLFGLRALGSTIPVAGVCVRRPAEQQRPRIATRCAEIADLLGVTNPVSPEDVVVDDRFLAPGYGRLNDAAARAIALGARTEALMLDPVYSGKALAGALAMAAEAGPAETVLFLHTGGSPGIFAYGEAMETAAAL